MRSDFSAFLALAFVGVVLFHVHLIGSSTFIGDSDRLNTFLNIRTFEVENIKHERPLAWDPFMFMGFNASGLHYMFVGADPVAYFEAFFPIRDLFRVAGYISCAFLILAAWSAYLFIKDTTHHSFAAFVGAVLYSLSAFSVVRIAQVDSAFAVLILIPLGLLILRRAKRDNAALCFLVLALLLALLLAFTFLQEAAYAVILFGAYAIYRSFGQGSLRPLGIFVIALCVAATITFPRLYTVFQDFRLLDRTSAFQTTCWCEIFRWFNDGVFGRYPEEQAAIGNGINLHEGLQLYTSTFAPLLVLAGALRFRGMLERSATVAFLTVLGWVFVPWIGLVPGLGLVILMVLTFLALTKVGGAAQDASRLRFQAVDAPFHLYFLTFALAVILIEPVRYLFYLAFLRIDFTHSRVSGTALLPICTLAGVFLSEMFGRSDERPTQRPGAIVMCLSMAFALGLLWLVRSLAEGPLTTHLGLIGLLRLGSWVKMLPAELMKVVWATVIFILLLVGGWVYWRVERVRWFLALSLGFMMVFQSLAYADFQLFGRQTWTFPVPFLDNNFFNVQAAALHPPSAAAMQAFQRRLEVDRYRSVVVADPNKFPAFSAPHLSQFWRLRLVGGYGAGVPRRLARLPWPEGVRTLRALTFTDTNHLPWPLLSILNVKYAVVVNPAFYYNLGHGRPEPSPRDVRIVRNPLPVVPRAFFAATVRPVRRISQFPATTSAPLAPVAVYPTVVSDHTIILSWTSVTPDARYEEERMDGNGGVYAMVGETGPDATSLANTSLKPGTAYYFRVRACASSGCSAYSPTVESVTATGNLKPPMGLAADVVSSSTIVLSWSGGTSDIRYRIERKTGRRTPYVEIGRTNLGVHSYRAFGLRSLTTYSFRVRACTDRGCSPHSAAASASTPSSLSISELHGILPGDPLRESIVEGFPHAARFSTQGRIRATYKGATIDIRVDPSDQPRFLVLNELYAPDWKAVAGSTNLPIYPTNIIMRGLLVPAGASHITLRFVPFLYTPPAALIFAGGIALLVASWWAFRHFEVQG